MPDSVMSAFSEPDDFVDAMSTEGIIALLVTAPGRFFAQLTQVSVNTMHLAAMTESMPRIVFTSVPAGTVLISFATGDTAAPCFAGLNAGKDELLIMSPREACHTRTKGAVRWGSVRLPLERLVEAGVALTGTAAFLSPGVWRHKPRAAAYRQLSSLHAAAIRLAASHPQALIDIEASHGLEQQLLYALVECLSDAPADRETRSAFSDRQTMAGLERLLQNGGRERTSMPQLCAALQIPERRLRRLCAEQLDMSPIVYDRLQRMSRVRRALARGGIIPFAKGTQDVVCRPDRPARAGAL